MSSGSTWFTEQVLNQPRLHNEPFSEEKKKEASIEKQTINKQNSKDLQTHPDGQLLPVLKGTFQVLLNIPESINLQGITRVLSRM